MSSGGAESSACEQYALFRSRVHALVDRVAEDLRDASPPLVAGYILEQRSRDSFGLTDGIRPEPRFLIGDHQIAITGSAAYNSVLEAVNEQPELLQLFLRTLKANDVLSSWIAWSAFLNRALLPHFRYEPRVVDELLDRLTAEGKNAATQFRLRAYFCPLGIECQNDVPLAGGVVRRISPDDRSRIFASAGWLQMLGLQPGDAAMLNSIFDMSFIAGTANPAMAEPDVSIEELRTALTLAARPVAFNLVTVATESVIAPSIEYPRRRATGRASVLESPPLPPLEISDDIARETDATLSRLKTSANVPLLQTAIRRLNESIDRVNADDALIDCVVGIESILTDESRTEITHKLKQRLAVTIGHSPQERKEIFQAMGDIYSTRGRVAHGKQPKKSSPRCFPTLVNT